MKTDGVFYISQEEAAAIVMEYLVGIRWRLERDETLSLIVPRMANMLCKEMTKIQDLLELRQKVLGQHGH